MNSTEQEQLILKLSYARYEDEGMSYDACDCAGAVALVLREKCGFKLPADRLLWRSYFDLITYPCALEQYDVLLMADHNLLGMVDHMAIYIGNGNIISASKKSGVICDRLSHHQTKILTVARMKNADRTARLER